MITVVIADDHPLVREGLKRVLERGSGISVIGEAADGLELLARVRELKPSVAIVDLHMPNMGGFDALDALKREHPHLPVLILSMQPEESAAVRALRSGAAGYLSKDRVPAELLDAVLRAAAGRRYVSPELAERLADAIEGDDPARPHERLSNREFEVLRLIAGGKNMNEIAELLSLSPSTIATYRSRLLDKMGMKGNAELVRYALEHRLIE